MCFRCFLRLLHGEFGQVILFLVFNLIVEQGTENKCKKVHQAFDFIVHDLRLFGNYKVGIDLPGFGQML